MNEFIYKIDNQQGTTDPEPDPCEHFEVHCSQCNWWGMLTNLKPMYVASFIRDEASVEPACPMCLSDQYLEYKED